MHCISLYSIIMIILCNIIVLKCYKINKSYFYINKLYLNRIFFEEFECVTNDNNNINAILHRDDYRYDHINKILKLKQGDQLRCGIVDKGMKNDCILASITNDNATILIGSKENIITINDRPRVDLVLCVPRPLRLEKLLPVISCIGVNNLVLLSASKVQADYFGSHLFRNPKALRNCLVEGLSQAEVDYKIPNVHIQKNFRHFIRNDLDNLFPKSNTLRIIAHPVLPKISSDSNDGIDIPSSRLFTLLNKEEFKDKDRVVVVIGPEGGWEQNEIKAFVDNDFNLVNVGNRILRTDMAVPVLLGLAHEWIELNGK